MPNLYEKRWERLAALGVKLEMPMPEGEAKMSAVILQLAEPMMTQPGTTAEQAEAILMLAIAGWNKSMFPPDKQPLVEKDLINALVPNDGSAEAVGVAVEVMDIIAERRKKLFPNLGKIIVDYEVEIGGGRLTLHVSSAPIPDLGQSEAE